jgi:hypothetical protein
MLVYINYVIVQTVIQMIYTVSLQVIEVLGYVMAL